MNKSEKNKIDSLEKEIEELKKENSSLKFLYNNDIIALKRIEDALRESDNLFRKFMDNMDAMIIIKDHELRPVFFNKKMKEYFPTEGWLGKTPEELFPPDVAKSMKEMDLKVFSEMVVEYEEIWNDKNGETHTLETRKFIIPREGNSPHIGAIVSDVTEKRKIEKALIESEEKYRTLVQYASDPIFSFNTDESYRFVNEAFAKPFGKIPEEIIGKTPHSIFPFEEAEKRLRLVRHVFKTSERGEIEVKVVTTTGEIRYYLTIVDPIKDVEGNIIWVNCISKEITERKRAEEEIKSKNEQLLKINYERDKFFSIIAHDLKSPLHGILGLTNMMASEIEEFTPSELATISEKIYIATDNLYKLLENLLEWIRMQQGTVNCNPVECDLSGLINNNLMSIQERAEQKGINCINEISYGKKVFVDIKMIDTVLRNILSNAVKFSNRGDIIKVSEKEFGDKMLEISIADTGIGMNEDDLNRLFKIEEKVGRLGTEGEESTGLGLLLSKEFVEKNGGKIRVESKEGQGSKFYFTIPTV